MYNASSFNRLVGAVAVAVGAKSVLDTKRRESGTPIVEKNLGVISSAEVGVAIYTWVVVKERDGPAQELALLVDGAGGLELRKLLNT